MEGRYVSSVHKDPWILHWYFVTGAAGCSVQGVSEGDKWLASTKIYHEVILNPQERIHWRHCWRVRGAEIVKEVVAVLLKVESQEPFWTDWAGLRGIGECMCVCGLSAGQIGWFAGWRAKEWKEKKNLTPATTTSFTLLPSRSLPPHLVHHHYFSKPRFNHSDTYVGRRCSRCGGDGKTCC